MFMSYLLGLAGVRSHPRPYQRRYLLVEAISRAVLGDLRGGLHRSEVDGSKEAARGDRMAGVQSGGCSLATARVTECHSKPVSRWRLLRKLASVVLRRRVRYLPVTRCRHSETGRYRSE